MQPATTRRLPTTAATNEVRQRKEVNLSNTGVYGDSGAHRSKESTASLNDEHTRFHQQIRWWRGIRSRDWVSADVGDVQKIGQREFFPATN